MSEIQRCFSCGHHKELHTSGECTGEHTCRCESYLAPPVEGLRAKIAALEAENGRLKAPVTDDDYMCMFLAMNDVNKEPGKPIWGMEVFNAILAARAQQPSPAQDKEQG